MGFFFVLLSWLAICAKDARTEVILATFSGFPGDKVEVNTTNYQQLPASYHEMKYGTEYEGIHYLRPYDMTERLVYTFLFTLKGDTGYIEIVFQEYDLNPRSILYIYNGGNESSAGTIWTHHSPVPMYHSTSSGAPLFMVFKTGQDAANKHMGFVANVYFKEKLWESPPMTGFCAPLKKTTVYEKHDVLSAEIINSQTADTHVFCSYTSHVTNAELVVASNVPEIEIDLRDFPSAAVGKRIPQSRYKNGTLERYRFVYLQVHVFNLRSAIHGFHLQLTARFTKPLQQVIVRIGANSTVLIGSIEDMAYRRYWSSDWNCPYKKCYLSHRCYDIHDTCSYNKHFERLDGTCDLYRSEPDAYVICEGSDHCYHVYTDHCDGFPDCVNGTDEEGCTTRLKLGGASECKARDGTIAQHDTNIQHTENSSSSLTKTIFKWIGILLGLFVVVVGIVYSIKQRQAIRARCIAWLSVTRRPNQPDTDAILPDDDVVHM